MRGSRVIYKRKATYIKPVSQARALGKEKRARSVNKMYLVTQVLSKTVQGELTDLQRSRNTKIFPESMLITRRVG